MEENPKFEVLALGIILDSNNKKILIAKRESDPNIPSLTWCFPGGRLLPGEDIDKTLKRTIKLKTGYDVKNIGTFFSQTHEENPNLLSVLFLTKVFEGEGSPGDDITELKWVAPSELENYFTIPIHKKLKEFLLELV